MKQWIITEEDVQILKDVLTEARINTYGECKCPNCTVDLSAHKLCICRYRAALIILDRNLVPFTLTETSLWDGTTFVKKFMEYMRLSGDDFTSLDRDNMISFGFSEVEVNFLMDCQKIEEKYK